jgi:hypothetical protein
MAKETGDIVKAVKGIVEAVPIYQDAIQPGAKQIGTALETVGKAVNLALEPIVGLVWGYDRIKEYVTNRLAEKLQNVPPERIHTPNLMIAGPTLEALRFAGSDESLRELYANLLATSLDSATARNAHPSFVTIIRDMSPDEAKVMRLFATRSSFPLVELRAMLQPQPEDPTYNIVIRNFSLIGREAACAYPELTLSYLDNLCRLGLLEILSGTAIVEPGIYEALENSPELEHERQEILSSGRTVGFERKTIRRTTFGWQFCQACVIDIDRAP